MVQVVLVMVQVPRSVSIIIKILSYCTCKLERHRGNFARHGPFPTERLSCPVKTTSFIISYKKGNKTTLQCIMHVASTLATGAAPKKKISSPRITFPAIPRHPLLTGTQTFSPARINKPTGLISGEQHLPKPSQPWRTGSSTRSPRCSAWCARCCCARGHGAARRRSRRARCRCRCSARCSSWPAATSTWSPCSGASHGSTAPCSRTRRWARRGRRSSWRPAARPTAPSCSAAPPSRPARRPPRRAQAPCSPAAAAT
jgi:hypothetical protein